MTVSERPLRRDAQRNRDALVTAARAVFGPKGLDAPLDEIARRAGVAIGTLYNHFPTRDELVEAAFLPVICQTQADAEQALALEPWAGFVAFLESFCSSQSADRGFTDVCTRTFEDAPGIESAKEVIGAKMARIIERAQEAGELRADFRPADLAIVGQATADSPHWRRALAFLLDGFRANAAHPLPED